SDCHNPNPDPKKDQYANTKSGGVKSGANRPDLILGAITTPGAYTDGKTDMYDLLYPMYIQNQAMWDAMIVDIAAYLGQVFSTSAPPGHLSVLASFTFVDQPVGTTSAPQTITLTNVGGSTVAVSSISSGNPSEFAVASSQ